MIKKIIPLFLCVLLLVACNAPTVELMSFIDQDTKLDYFGRVVEAFNSDGYVWAYPDNDTMQSDALKHKIAEVEEKLNVDIVMSYDGDSDFTQYFTYSTLAGNCTTDLIYRHGGNSLWFIAEAGVLTPITDFPDIIDLSLTDKYGTPGVLEAAMFNGIPYAVQPVDWPGLQGFECFFIAFNTQEFAQNGLTSLHEYYENKTWTWDTFKKFLDIAEPVVGEGEYIFEAHGGYLMNTLFMANGFDFITFIDGIPTFDLTPKEALTAIEFLKTLSNYGDAINIAADRWACADFVDGNALTTMATSNSVTTGTVAYGDSPYSIVPFPSGPDVEYGKWAQSVTRIYGLSIPISAEDPECVAYIIRDLCTPFEEFGSSREGLMAYYRSNVFTSDLDVEIFFSVENNVRYDYDDAGLINEYAGVIAERIDSGSPMELIEKNSNVVKNIFTQYIEPNLTGYLIEKMNIE